MQSQAIQSQSELVSDPSNTNASDFAAFNALFNCQEQPVSAAHLSVLFEAQVAQTPAASALQFEQEVLSYQALNQRANQLAHQLRAFGVGAEQVIGLALPCSIERVVALLAIMKTGAAYLPLDPNYPEQRLAYMQADAKPVRVLTCSTLASRILGDAPHLLLDQFDFSAWSSHNLEDSERLVALQVDHLAYLIYTSGSTGRPKGVMITHRGIANLILSWRQRFAVDSAARVLQFASISFDVAFLEIASTLCSGATLVLASATRLMPGDALIALIAETKVSHLILTPSALAVMRLDSLPSVRMLMVASEACPPYLVEQWSHGRCLMNGYGPTEITVCATTSAPLQGGLVPPLGQPLLNTKIYLLDAAMQPVAAGVAGELYIASPGLARGYLGQPELTAERFISNPFGPVDSLMYRTGDLVSWQLDGNLQFLGRIDQQVKIRGFRVEPGEVEALLVRHPAVLQAVVVARLDTHAQTQLAAYLVLASGTQVSVDSLRQYLVKQLPDYLVPAAIILLPSLPLNPNGKLDRNALPAPIFQATSNTVTRNPDEEALAVLFREILGVEEIGIDDSFFQAGGHSLAATLLIHRVRATLGVRLELDDVFQTPTVAGLAALLAAGRENAVRNTRPRLQLKQRA
jgi:amino acid adenylation domain-containing protein